MKENSKNEIENEKLLRINGKPSKQQQNMYIQM